VKGNSVAIASEMSFGGWRKSLEGTVKQGHGEAQPS